MNGLGGEREEVLDVREVMVPVGWEEREAVRGGRVASWMWREEEEPSLRVPASVKSADFEIFFESTCVRRRRG